jgi:hypothetical protein
MPPAPGPYGTNANWRARGWPKWIRRSAARRAILKPASFVPRPPGICLFLQAPRTGRGRLYFHRAASGSRSGEGDAATRAGGCGPRLLWPGPDRPQRQSRCQTSLRSFGSSRRFESWRARCLEAPAQRITELQVPPLRYPGFPATNINTETQSKLCHPERSRGICSFFSLGQQKLCVTLRI